MRKKKLEQPADAYLDLPMEEVDALYESNLIENEKSMMALEDAIEAWAFAKDGKDALLGSFPDARDYILGIHKRLMKRLAPKIAGKIRDCDVWIGGEYKPFKGESFLLADLNEWIMESRPLKKYRKLTIEEREDLAKKWHVAFEDIHSAVDGNGRQGRILYQIHRLLLGLPIKVIAANTKYEEYYPWFRTKR